MVLLAIVFYFLSISTTLSAILFKFLLAVVFCLLSALMTLLIIACDIRFFIYIELSYKIH